MSSNGNFDRFVPGFNMNPPGERSNAAGGGRRNDGQPKRGPKKGKKKGGGQQNAGESPQPRSPEEIVKRCVPQMREALKQVFTKKAGILDVEYRVEPKVIAGTPPEIHLTLDISSVRCVKGTDFKKLEDRLGDVVRASVKYRKSENVRLLLETKSMKVIEVDDQASQKLAEPKLTDADPKPAIKQEPITPESNLRRMFKRWLGGRAPAEMTPLESIRDGPSPYRDDMVRRAVGEKAAAEARVREITAAMERMQSEMQGKVARAEAAAVANARELASLRTKLGEVEAEKKDVTEQLTKAHGEEKERLERDLAALRTQKATAEAKYVESEGRFSARIKELESAIARHGEQLETLHAERERIRRESGSKDARLEEAGRARDLAHKQRDTARRFVAETTATMKTLREELERAHAAAAEAQVAAEREHGTIAAENARLARERGESAHQLEGARTKIEELNARVAELSEELRARETASAVNNAREAALESLPARLSPWVEDIRLILDDALFNITNAEKAATDEGRAFLKTADKATILAREFLGRLVGDLTSGKIDLPRTKELMDRMNQERAEPPEPAQNEETTAAESPAPAASEPPEEPVSEPEGGSKY